jgi:autoinducer 2-degrading protein
MLVLIVHFSVKQGEEENAKEWMRKMQERTRREPGCRLYVGHQSAEDPRRFCFYEQYDDQAALDAHRAAPYFSQFVTNGLAKLIEGRIQELFMPVD